MADILPDPHTSRAAHNDRLDCYITGIHMHGKILAHLNVKHTGGLAADHRSGLIQMAASQSPPYAARIQRPVLKRTCEVANRFVGFVLGDFSSPLMIALFGLSSSVFEAK